MIHRTTCAVLLTLTAATAHAQSQPASTNADDQPAAPPAAGTMATLLARANRWFGGDENGPPGNGLYAAFNYQITGSGVVSIGPGYHYRFGDRAIVDTSVSVSVRRYELAQGRFEWTDLGNHRVRAGAQAMWRDMKQIDYFGIGSATSEGDRSEFRLKTTEVAGYSTFRAMQGLVVNGTLGWLHQPTVASPSGAFRRDVPSALDAFPSDPGMQQQPDFLRADASVVADTRDNHDYARRGGVYRVAAAAYWDRDFGRNSFRRYELEGVQYVPIVPNKLTLAVHGWGVLSDTSRGNSVPFYLLPALGGNDTLRGFHDYRFHDRDLLLLSAEARVHAHRVLDIATFLDAGNVAATAGHLNVKKTSIGVGARLHTHSASLGRLDIAHSVEGWQCVLRANDPFRLARLLRHTGEGPFVP